MFFNIRSFLVVTFACLLAANVRAELKFTAAAAPELDAPFQTTNGWTGADGNFSVPLSSNKTVWLFSDTWVGAVENGKRARAKLINNSIALQSTGGQPEFFYRANSAGEPESFIKPESGEGYFWLFHGARNEKGLYLFLQRVKTTGQGAFGFQLIGASIGYVKNPDDHPMLWKVEQTEFPFCDFSNEEKIFFGSAILEHKNSFYIFGNRRDREKDANGMIVARVPEKDFGDFKKWRFYSKGRWVDNFRASTPVSPDPVAEVSAFYEPKLRKFVLLYSQGLNGKIVARTAKSPTGPWSEATELFQCPEMKWSEKVFCYAGKAHPELATKPGEWIITYAANSRNFWELIADARLYWPRFVRVELK